MEKFALQSVSIGREVIAYRQAGEGEQKIVLIHGNMSSSRHVEILMEKLVSTFSVTAFDLRGMGGSSYNEGFDSLHELADDLKEAMVELAIDQAHVFGWSTGGGVALSMAARYPESVKSLILMSSVGLSGYPIFKKDENFQPILMERLLTKEEIAQDPVQVLPVLQALEAGNKEFYRALWNQVIYVCGNQPEPDLYDYYLEDMLSQKNLVDIDFALTRFNMTSVHNGVIEGSGLVAKVTQPTLILYGEKDYVVPAYMTEELKTQIPGPVTFKLLANCAHNPLIDDLDQVTQAIEEQLHGLS